MCAQIVQKTAVVACDHQGQAQIQQASTRVSVAGQPVVLVPTTLTVSGCPLTSGNSLIPCATIQFSQGTTCVTSQKQALMLDSSIGLASGPLPSQGGAQINAVQQRVAAK